MVARRSRQRKIAKRKSNDLIKEMNDMVADANDGNGDEKSVEKMSEEQQIELALEKSLDDSMDSNLKKVDSAQAAIKRNYVQALVSNLF